MRSYNSFMKEVRIAVKDPKIEDSCLLRDCASPFWFLLIVFVEQIFRLETENVVGTTGMS